MRAAKLVQHMKSNTERMSEAVVLKRVRASQKCSELSSKIADDEQKFRVPNVYLRPAFRAILAVLATSKINNLPVVSSPA